MRTLTLADEQAFLQQIHPNYDINECRVPQTFHINKTIASWLKARDLLAILLMLDGGLRVGEVIGLARGDCYFQNAPVKMLTVRSEISKSKCNRDIPVSTRLFKTLELYQQGPITICLDSKTDPLIVSNPYRPSYTTRSLQNLCTHASGLSLPFRVTPHLLRHTFATKLMKLTDIRTVQTLLGHRSLSSTQIYTHVNDDDKRSAIEGLQG